MAAVSPTPKSSGSHFSVLGRRTSARQALRRPQSRQQLSRSESSPVTGSVTATRIDTSKAQSQLQQHASNLNDSSDDEIPVPMKLSALTKALLDDGGDSAAQLAGIPPPGTQGVVTRKRNVVKKSIQSAALDDKLMDGGLVRQTRRHVRSSSAQITTSRQSSPNRSRESSPAPRKRVVRLSATSITPGGGGGSVQDRLRRSTSTSLSTQRKRIPSRDRSDDRNKVLDMSTTQEANPNSNSNLGLAQVGNATPVSSVRRVNIVTGSSGARATTSGSSCMGSKPSGSDPHSDHELPEDPQTVARSHGSLNQGSASRYGANAAKRSEDAAPQSSMRVKRIGKIPGSFLSGPARRGRRRQSDEEENSPAGEHGEVAAEVDQEADNMRPSQEREGTPQRNPDLAGPSFYAPKYRELPAASGSPISTKDPARASMRNKPLGGAGLAAAMSGGVDKENIHPMSRSPGGGYGHRPKLPSSNDQENAAHSAAVVAPLRKEEDLGALALSDKLFTKLGKEVNDGVENIHIPSVSRDGEGMLQSSLCPSPDRKVLSQMSRNTPLRPAPPPPPPKMSVLHAATATAGAAATLQASKKQRVLLKVNGRAYHRLDCIGRGGSAKVYRVTAENGKMFALKRVSLENADPTAVKGFLCEIDLLKRLSGIDRVIQMYDSELNQEKRVLSVLMEMGELDFTKLLKQREDQRLDTVFVRSYWKEMLECLQAVHACDIVHLDLKPDNFVLVKGRLKLIDFGIAGAIQTDETVNVHRESQIGTPNYMSPESLMDSQHYAAAAANDGRFDRSHGRPRLMKVGKPSDIWSLGCILYKLVYGQPPFGHIPHHLARCQAIIAWDHKISFPEKGLGGVFVPPSLIRTMKRCLVRDQQLRPTCEELLSEHDPFLYPQEYDMDRVLPMTEEFLGRIIQSVVARCRDRMPTDSEIISAWPAAYWASMKRSVGAKDMKP